MDGTQNRPVHMVQGVDEVHELSEIPGERETTTQRHILYIQLCLLVSSLPSVLFKPRFTCSCINTHVHVHVRLHVHVTS